jgi:hypothetical protein
VLVERWFVALRSRFGLVGGSLQFQAGVNPLSGAARWEYCRDYAAVGDFAILRGGQIRLKPRHSMVR